MNNNFKNNTSKSRMQQIQEEFKMSDLEITEIYTFISTLKNETTILDALEKLVEYDNLNIRQKVAFSHLLGIFRIEGAQLS